MRASKDKRKAVVLLSGGIDSATTLYLARQKKLKSQALIFDYGQSHKKEITFAKRVARRARCPYKVIKLRLPGEGSSLLGRKKNIPLNRSFSAIKEGIPSTYVPGRNLIFLSIATSFAESVNARAIFIGAHTQDFSGYPDCRKAFFVKFKKVITAGTKDGKHISICAPLINKNKKEIIEIALKLGVPLEHTWSCYKGGKAPCGACDSCRFREKGFKELGIADPYYERS